MANDEKLKNDEMQSDISKEATRQSALSSSKLGKF